MYSNYEKNLFINASEAGNMFNTARAEVKAGQYLKIDNS